MSAQIQSYTESNSRNAVATELQKVLADTFALYFKTHSYHWNVEGQRFHSLHEMFEEQYTEMWEAIDEIAERLRALDVYAPTSLKALLENATLEEEAKNPDADTMVNNLANGHTEISATLAKAVEVAEDAGDNATADMFIARIQVHEKTAWMLRAINK